MIKSYGDYNSDIHETCDVCIIGSGPGGAVVAKELSEKGRSVVLLEEGGHYTKEDWKGVSQGVYVDDFEDQGIMLEGIFVHPSMLLSALPGIGHDHKDLAVKFNNLSAFGVMVHDEATGRVFNVPGIRRYSKPLSTYFLAKNDVEKLKKGMANIAKIFFAAGAIKVFTGISKMPVLNSPDDVEKLLKLKVKPIHIEILAFHPLGSCRMASSPKLGAVNRDGETYDVKDLFVSDGSIIPTSLGVNPQVTIMAMASLVADRIDNRLSKNADA